MSRLRILGAALGTAAVLCMLVLAEAVVRLIDGFPLFRLRLPAAAVNPQIADERFRQTADARYFSQIPLVNGVDRAWYEQNPAPIPRMPLTPELQHRYERYKSTDPYGAFFGWNHRYLSMMLCKGATFGSLGILDDFYVFEPPTDTQFPPFRHLSNISPPAWFPTNRFGWRGPDVALNKPIGTIRLAFVGSSMTIDPYGAPFSHIEYIGEWLNRWAQARRYPYHIEVINAARTGIDAASVAAIVLQELLPLEPDLVIFDGANDFKPGQLLHLPAQGLPPPPPLSIRPPGQDFSAVMRRIRVLSDRLGRGTEPRKPSYPIDWPSGVDELHPDVTRTPLPMLLDDVVGHFDVMRTALAATGSRLALSSQVAMARDKLQLQLPRDQTLYQNLNSAYYPLTYSEIRRLMDFQNRVFQAYAARHRLLFFDKAAASPLDPALFGDMVHMTPAGLRLQSWLYLQWLASWLETEITEGRLPRAMRHPQDVHPGFSTAGYPLMTRAQILDACH